MTIGLNPFALSKELAMMNDQQLAQLAQQHSDDAVVMSALMAEKQRRQHMHGAVQAQQAPQGQQATVREQLMSSMMPEDTGVAQVAGAGSGYADGGIVGYAGDKGSVVEDDTPWYQWRNPRGFADRLRNPFTAAGEWLGEKAFDLTQSLQKQSVPAYMQRERPTMAVPAPAPTASVLSPAGDAAFASQGFTPAAPGAFLPQGMVMPTPTLATTPPAQPPAPRVRSAAPGAGGPSVEPSMRGIVVPGPIAGKVEEAGTKQTEALKAQYEAAKKDAEDKLGQMPVAYAKRKEELEAEEGKSAEDRKTARSMALLDMGLQMMQGGSTQRGLAGLVADVGRAAGVSMKTYKAELKEIKAAEEKRKEGLAMIAEAQRQQKMGNFAMVQELAEKGRAVVSNSVISAGAATARALGTDQEAGMQLATTHMKIDAETRIANAANRSREAIAASSERASIAQQNRQLKAAQGNLTAAIKQLANVQKELGTYPTGARKEQLMQQQAALELEIANAKRDVATAGGMSVGLPTVSDGSMTYDAATIPSKK